MNYKCQKYSLSQIDGIPVKYKKSIEDLFSFKKDVLYDYDFVNKKILEFLNNPKVKEIIKNIFNDFKNKLISIFYNKYISFIFISQNYKIIYLPTFKKSGTNEFDLLFNDDQNLDLTPITTNYEINRIVKKT